MSPGAGNAPYRTQRLRGTLIVGGVLSLAGVVGPAVGVISLRWIGQVGYEAVFPAVCLLLALVFRRTVAIGSMRGMTD